MIAASVLLVVATSLQPTPAFGVGASKEPVELTLSGVPPSATLQVTTNVGTISAVEKVDAHTWRARLLPPAERYPQVAIVCARVVDGESVRTEFAGVPIHGTSTLEIQTKPRASVVVDVSGTKFGPHRADARGQVSVPVQVPPGVDVVYAVSTDRLGNTTTKPLRIDPPPFTHSRVVPADDRPPSWADKHPLLLDVYVVRRSGAPAQRAPELTVDQGDLAAIERVGPGHFRASYRAPTAMQGAAAKLVVHAAEAAPFTYELPLASGPPAQLRLSASPTPFRAGSGVPLDVHAEVVDAHGNAVFPAVPVSLRTSLHPGTISTDSGQARVDLPSDFRGHQELTLHASAGGAATSIVVPLLAGAPARMSVAISTTVVHAGQKPVVAMVHLGDEHGNPVVDAQLHAVSDALDATTEPAPRPGDYRVRIAAPPDAPPGTAHVELRTSDGRVRAQLPMEIASGARGGSVGVGAYAAARAQPGAGGWAGALELSVVVPRFTRFEIVMRGGIDGAQDAAAEEEALFWSGAALSMGVRASKWINRRWVVDASALFGRERIHAGARDSALAVTRRWSEDGWRGTGALGVGALLGPGRVRLEAGVDVTALRGPGATAAPLTAFASVGYVWRVR